MAEWEGASRTQQLLEQILDNLQVLNMYVQQQSQMYRQFQQQQQQPQAIIAPPVPETPPQSYPVQQSSQGGSAAAVSSPEVGIPEDAMRMSLYPETIISAQNGEVVYPDTGILDPSHFEALAPGTISVAGALATNSPGNGPFTITKDGGNTWGQFNSAVTMTLGAEYAFSTLVDKGDVVDISVSGTSPCTIQNLRVFYTESV